MEQPRGVLTWSDLDTSVRQLAERIAADDVTHTGRGVHDS